MVSAISTPQSSIADKSPSGKCGMTYRQVVEEKELEAEPPAEEHIKSASSTNQSLPINIYSSTPMPPTRKRKRTTSEDDFTAFRRVRLYDQVLLQHALESIKDSVSITLASKPLGPDNERMRLAFIQNNSNAEDSQSIYRGRGFGSSVHDGYRSSAQSFDQSLLQKINRGDRRLAPGGSQTSRHQHDQGPSSIQLKPLSFPIHTEGPSLVEHPWATLYRSPVMQPPSLPEIYVHDSSAYGPLRPAGISNSHDSTISPAFSFPMSIPNARDPIPPPLPPPRHIADLVDGGKNEIKRELIWSWASTEFNNLPSQMVDGLIEGLEAVRHPFFFKKNY